LKSDARAYAKEKKGYEDSCLENNCQTENESDLIVLIKR